MREYSSRRRDFDPLWKLGDWEGIRKTRLLLEKYQVPQTQWTGYLDYVFAGIGRWSGGRLKFPPIHSLASRKMIDAYSARPECNNLDRAHARQMLHDAGFGDGRDPDFGAVIAVVVDIWPNKRAVGLDPQYDEAVTWLFDHFEEIGYK
jgi:hypothetical protein